VLRAGSQGGGMNGRRRFFSTIGLGFLLTGGAAAAPREDPASTAEPQRAPAPITPERRAQYKGEIVGAGGTYNAKPTSIFRSKSCLPIAPGLPIGERRLRYVAVLGAALRASQYLPVTGYVGSSDGKRNRSRKRSAPSWLRAPMCANGMCIFSHSRGCGYALISSEHRGRCHPARCG
jgi:hypothetical protein